MVFTCPPSPPVPLSIIWWLNQVHQLQLVSPSLLLSIVVVFFFPVLYLGLLFLLSFNFTQWSAGTTKSTIRQILFFFFLYFFFFYYDLVWSSGRDWMIRLPPRGILGISFSRTDSGLCIFHDTHHFLLFILLLIQLFFFLLLYFLTPLSLLFRHILSFFLSFTLFSHPFFFFSMFFNILSPLFSKDSFFLSFFLSFDFIFQFSPSSHSPLSSVFVIQFVFLIFFSFVCKKIFLSFFLSFFLCFRFILLFSTSSHSPLSSFFLILCFF